MDKYSRYVGSREVSIDAYDKINLNWVKEN